MKIIQLSDTHLMPPGGRLYGFDPRERLARVIDDINRNHGDADFCVLSGDLCDVGEVAAYRVLRDCLAALALPRHLMVGNHDDRAAMCEVFPEVRRDANGFVQYAFEAGDWSFLMLDTVEPGTSAGSFCERRADWLRAELEAAGDRPVFVFMHHPPFDIGIPCLDRIRLRDESRFAAALDGHDQVRHICFGHVHRPVSGTWRGIPFSALRSTNHQVPLDLDERLSLEASGKVPKIDEPAGYAVILIEDERVVVHQHDLIAASHELL
ncbi:MAG: phosphodiesterase [Alphaproteobacteria bacterium]|nr:phosphodiesterase [Alphaproteobacteria bacterium]